MSLPLLKRTYVSGIRQLRTAAQWIGLLDRLEQSPSRHARWVRSLFGIYDSLDLVRLDWPWWTFPAIDETASLLNRLNGRARVFEFGAGASTVWLSKRAKAVFSVEHDVTFAETLRPTLETIPHVTLSIIPPVPATGRAGEKRSCRAGHTTLAFDAYVRALEQTDGLFDLIVIDGRSRAACLEAARAKLSPGGRILFDNSNRPEYQAAMAASGFRVRRFRGLAPALPFPSETSILEAPRA